MINCNEINYIRNNLQQIPYRVNKLTRLFQAYFEGKSMVKMIVNFNPSLSCFDESIGVLKFSSIANQVNQIIYIFLIAFFISYIKKDTTKFD